MRREAWLTLIAGLLVFLLFSALMQVWVLPSEIKSIVAQFPETEPLATPGFVWGVFAVACWQAVAVMGIRLAVLARDDRLHTPAYGWLCAIVGCLLVFLVLVVGAFNTLVEMDYETPGAMLGLILGALAAVITLVSVAWYFAIKPVVRRHSYGGHPGPVGQRVRGARSGAA